MSNSSNPSHSPPSVTAALGGGLVEIATLTALIGSRTAESLTLGNKGAAGLPWAVMSIFGVVYVVRACIAAITPGWLRETLAVRTAETDAALGWSLDLQMKNLRSRGVVGGAVGISRRVVPERARERPRPRKEATKEDIRDVYAFDQTTSTYLSLVPAHNPSEPLKVYIIEREFYRLLKFDRVTRNEAIGLASSAVKLAEFFILWRRKAKMLSLVSSASWAFFFLGSLIIIVLQKLQKLRSHRPEIDILCGKLPKPPFSAGEERKVVLGLPPNGRENLAWTLIWFFGGLVCAASLVATYTILTAQDRDTFYTWMGFQILFLVSRSAFFHFAQGPEAILGHPGIRVYDWRSLPSQYKPRVRGLIFALSNYQMQVHPRGSYSYTRDLQSLDTLGTVIPAYGLPPETPQTVPLHIEGVVGDTLLSSTLFALSPPNKPQTGSSLYDSCIVLLRLPSPPSRSHTPSRPSLSGSCLISIPSSRVCTDAVPPSHLLSQVSDPESSLAQNPPRGEANSGRAALSWQYWIPCTKPSTWLQVRVPVDGKMEGGVEREGQVVGDKEVDGVLMRGELFISLKRVEEVREIVEESREGVRVLGKMLGEI